jgi:FkbM family methyltransferase
LRARISYKLYRLFPKINDKNISLEFNKNIRLSLSKTDFGHKSIIFNGFYELQLTKAILKLGKQGGLLIDVGANYGYYTCLWASQGAKNKVIAFEASPDNIRPLYDNVQKNDLNNKVTIMPLAAGKEKGYLQFSLGGNSLQTSWGGFTIMEDGASVKVPVETLDDYAEKNEITNIKVLKIDTEGGDTWVLYGAEKLLRQKRIEHIFFEHNEHRMGLLNIKKDEAVTFFKKMGYTVQKRSATDFYAYPNFF